MEKWNLHVRIALRLLIVAGNNRNAMLGGFMAITAGMRYFQLKLRELAQYSSPTYNCSMFISNTATASVMVPIVVELLQQLHASVCAPPPVTVSPETASNPEAIEMEVVAEVHDPESVQEEIEEPVEEPGEKDESDHREEPAEDINSSTSSTLDPEFEKEFTSYSVCNHSTRHLPQH